MFKWEFIIQDKPYANRHEWKYTVLNKPENMKRLTTDLEKFGILGLMTMEKMQLTNTNGRHLMQASIWLVLGKVKKTFLT